jgi:Flp pilus assembly protein TadG
VRATKTAPRGPQAGAVVNERGQATVEVVALLPMLVVAALAVVALLAAGQARELAGHAAAAGAMAILQGSDPEDAARAAAPGWSRERMDVRVSGRRVRVRVRPRPPFGLAGRMLEATAVADAGPR